jgi:hypothetical protein
MPSSNFDNHVCSPQFKGVRHIPLNCWWLSKTESGEDLVMILGLDGYLYRFRATKVKEFEPLSPEMKRSLFSPEDGTEPRIAIFLQRLHRPVGHEAIMRL